MLSGFISTSSILSLFGLTRYTSTAFAQMEIQVLDNSGGPYEINGVSTLKLQHNPDKITEAYSAQYNKMSAIGLIRPTLHYTKGESAPIPIEVILEDSYEGTPHSTVDSEGNIVYNDFADLEEVFLWIKALRTPVSAWRKPPFVKVVWGKWRRLGVVENVNIEVIKRYPDATPRIAKVSLVLQPDVIIVTNQQSFFNVR